jgi:hypothetical protein
MPPQKYVLGIDPGKQGGLAVLTMSGKVWNLTKMPETETDLWNWFQQAVPDNTVVAIEKVHSMPGNRAGAMFTFGHGYGNLRMAIIARGLQFEAVPPPTWMKGLKIPSRKKKTKTNKTEETKTQYKNRLRCRAQELFPSFGPRGFSITLATADALLIAEYYRRFLKGLIK